MAAVLIAAGAEGIEMPDLLTARERLDEALTEPFDLLPVIDAEKADLMDALGLRRAG